MPRRNGRGGRPQARRVERKGYAGPPPPPITALVVPKGKCYFHNRHGKLIFTEAEATKALRQAQAARERRGSGHREERTYQCPEGGCGGWHLTSRKTYEERGQG